MDPKPPFHSAPSPSVHPGPPSYFSAERIITVPNLASLPFLGTIEVIFPASHVPCVPRLHGHTQPMRHDQECSIMSWAKAGKCPMGFASLFLSFQWTSASTQEFYLTSHTEFKRKTLLCVSLLSLRSYYHNRSMCLEDEVNPSQPCFFSEAMEHVWGTTTFGIVILDPVHITEYRFGQ